MVDSAAGRGERNPQPLASCARDPRAEGTGTDRAQSRARLLFTCTLARTERAGARARTLPSRTRAAPPLVGRRRKGKNANREKGAKKGVRHSIERIIKGGGQRGEKERREQQALTMRALLLEKKGKKGGGPSPPLPHADDISRGAGRGRASLRSEEERANEWGEREKERGAIKRTQNDQTGFQRTGRGEMEEAGVQRARGVLCLQARAARERRARPALLFLKRGMRTVGGNSTKPRPRGFFFERRAPPAARAGTRQRGFLGARRRRRDGGPPKAAPLLPNRPA